MLSLKTEAKTEPLGDPDILLVSATETKRLYLKKQFFLVLE